MSDTEPNASRQMESVNATEVSMTVYVVATCYADDPHPYVEAVYSNRDSAELHAKEIDEDIRPASPVAWKVLEQEVDPHE